MLVDNFLKKKYAKPKVSAVQFSRQHVSSDSAGTFRSLDHTLFNSVACFDTFETNHPQKPFAQKFVK